MVTEVNVISDTHFYDSRMLKYLERPFSSIIDMNESLISNWNEVVSRDEIVIHLGDLSLDYDFDNMKDIVSRLNGYKILIRGNWDAMSNKFYEHIGFDKVYDQTLKIGEYIFSHYPIFKLPDNIRNFHGHSHKYVYKGNKINCNIDIMGMYPMKFRLWDVSKKMITGD